VARARAGQLTARDVWREFVEGLPQGLPAADEHGLDYSSSRERVYWGGNLFWLLADVQIRVRTGNRHSVDDAIRAILKAGGNGDASWSIERVIRVGDTATGTTVLKDLYGEIGLHRGDIQLGSLWQALGVVYRHGGVRFDDSAPWAAFRASITARR
jgi:predicted metalloprotease with PDZ domain